MKRIAFDFDGVIADTNNEKIKWLKNKGINIKNVDKTNFYKLLSKDLEKNKIDLLYKNMSKDIFTPQILENTKPVKSSINIIKRLATQFKIYIITARTEEMIKPLKKWLKEYDIDKNIEEIISSSNNSKQDICINKDIIFLCDDDLRHVIDNKVKIRVLFSNEKTIEDKSIIIADSWKELENIILN